MHVQTCNCCGDTKPINEFPKNGTDNDGKPRWRPDCTVCYTIKRKIDKRKHTKFVCNTRFRTGEDDTYQLQDWRDALIFFKGACAYCGRPHSRRFKLTKEHVIPVDKGGKTVRANIIPACGLCNSSKSNERFESWYSRQKFYAVQRMERINQWRSQQA